MEAFFEVLKYTIPGLIVFAATYFLMKSYLDNDLKKQQIESKTKNQKVITPIRLQAYERLAMYLERISPESLLIRIQDQSMTVSELQQALLVTIRAEFEHNISQQIYVSGKLWMAIKAAKDNTVRLVNQVAASLPPTASANELSKRMLQTVMSIDKSPSQMALEILKMEVGLFM